MTQGGGCAGGASRPHRAAFHLGLVDEDTRNEPCHQVSALGNRPLVHRRSQAWTKRLAALGQGGPIALRRCLGIALPQWRREPLVGLRPRLASTRTRLARAPLRQVSIAPPRLWACALRQTVTPRVPPRWQGLVHLHRSSYVIGPPVVYLGHETPTLYPPRD